MVICDPELTLDLPPAITAGTGLDAFAHCVEAFSSPHYQSMSHGIALEGMRLVKEYLPRAYGDGHDIEARAQMMSVAMMGATAFQKGLGAIHAMSHPVARCLEPTMAPQMRSACPPFWILMPPQLPRSLIRLQPILGSRVDLTVSTGLSKT